MNKCHQNINWQNDTTPAINETNLNYMDGCIDTIDDRVVAIANDPPANALKAEGWAIGEQSGVPVTSGSPYYENNSKYYSQESANEVLKSEGFANGTQGGVPVSSGSPYYENNAKYWKEQAQAIASQTLSGLTDVSIQLPQDGQTLIYDGNSGEWVNKTVSSSRTPNNITSRLSDLPTAVSEQNLEKYGYKIGDYFERTDGARTYRYWLADMDTFYGGYDQYAIVSTHHIGLVVDSGATSTWNDSGSASNYGSSTLHNYLSGTVLNNIKADMIALFGGSTGLEHLLSHTKLYPSVGGSSDATSQYISALSEVQIYGAPIWSADVNQQGEADEKLELFNLYKYNRVFGNVNVWLRSIQSNIGACCAYANGVARFFTFDFNLCRAAGLILFH